ncbi:hypothetical protein J1N35_040429 [Gossypium stocksii]|uniref:Uncharacterized protein n=1 Tax=Gossypium stocksii TaxID=47602 RepID=A0A9D3UDT2_9ROSI|nr:hypothetical protein J1N35_040429 [Gossypium stocksii]
MGWAVKKKEEEEAKNLKMNLIQSKSTKSSQSINPSLLAFPPPVKALFNFGFSKANNAIPTPVPIPAFNNLGTTIFARPPLEVPPHEFTFGADHTQKKYV